MEEMTTLERRPLTRERICAAALALIDAEGLSRLTMQRLGGALGVEGMAIYKHLPNKAAVLDGVLEQLLEELPEPEPEPSCDWQASLGALCTAAWELGYAHPNLLPLLAARPLATPSVRRLSAGVREILRRAGFAEVAAVRVEHTLGAYLLGYGCLIAGSHAAGVVESAPDLEANPRPAAADPDAVSADLAAAARRADFEAGLALVLRGAAEELH